MIIKPSEADNAPTEFAKFDKTIRTLLSVSRSELQRREAEYQKQAALKPKRGPKPKRTPTAPEATADAP